MPWDSMSMLDGSAACDWCDRRFAFYCDNCERRSAEREHRDARPPCYLHTAFKDRIICTDCLAEIRANLPAVAANRYE